MAEVLDIQPLDMRQDGNVLRFVLARQDDIYPELPGDYEELLSERLARTLAESAPEAVEVDLAGVAALNSRQLGALITLQKVLRGRFGRIPIHGVSTNVRNLLALTHVDKLFELI